jgi:hypothetical protein
MDSGGRMGYLGWRLFWPEAGGGRIGVASILALGSPLYSR